MKNWSLPIEVALEFVFGFTFFFKWSSTLISRTVLMRKICNLYVSCNEVPLEFVFGFTFFFEWSSTLISRTAMTRKICNLCIDQKNLLSLSCTGIFFKTTAASGLKTHVACVTS